MSDTSVTKVSSEYSPEGKLGQKYLASGVTISMRLWTDEEPGDTKPEVSREYETVGYVLKGSAELVSGRPDALVERGRFVGRAERGQTHVSNQGNVQRGRGHQPAGAHPRPRPRVRAFQRKSSTALRIDG